MEEYNRLKTIISSRKSWDDFLNDVDSIPNNSDSSTGTPAKTLFNFRIRSLLFSCIGQSIYEVIGEQDSIMELNGRI